MQPAFRAEPDLSEWSTLAVSRRDGAFAGRSLSEWREIIRAELGLPTDQIIIATGHQAQIWHPGILAKFIAADALVETLGRERAAAAHLVVDQDNNECRMIDVPIIGEKDLLHVERAWLVAPGPESCTFYTPYGTYMEGPTGDLPAMRPADPPELNWPVPSIGEGVRSMHEALNGELARARSLAEQFARACHQLMAPWVQEMPLISARSLLATSIGRALIDAMRSDPKRCAEFYNEAVRANPEAKLTELTITGEQIEMPLWRFDDGGLRDRAWLTDLRERDFDESCLRPRALMMTAILRLAVCDLFIHGTGGLLYDRATEQWMREWLGVELAPIVMCTADLYLPLREGNGSPPPLDKAISHYRKLLHDPLRTGHEDGAISTQKRKYLATIDSLPRRSLDRREAFREYHKWLDRGRTERAGVIERAGRDVVEHEILTRRDWAFPLYPREEIDALARAIGQALAKHESAVVESSDQHI